MARISIGDLGRWKREGQRFVCLTAYDAPIARILEAREIPLILVGDSVGNVVLGHRDTVAVTVEDMLHHSAAVRRGAPNTFVIADMPFGSYQISTEDAVRNAARFLQEAGADAVKLEGAGDRIPAIERIVGAGIPTVGHLGLTPQNATQLGGLRVQATTADSAETLLADALALERAGIFSLVLECVPEEVARIITERLSIPTIGIGAGPHCDAQVLVIHDLLGITAGFRPKFVRAYTNLEEQISTAVSAFRKDVEEGAFPADAELFSMPDAELTEFRRRLGEEDRS